MFLHVQLKDKERQIIKDKFKVSENTLTYWTEAT